MRVACFSGKLSDPRYLFRKKVDLLYSKTHNYVVWPSLYIQSHELLLRRSAFEPTLQQMSWRIDLKTASRSAADVINQPTAIVELVLATVSGYIFRFNLFILHIYILVTSHRVVVEIVGSGGLLHYRLVSDMMFLYSVGYVDITFPGCG